MGLFTPAWKGKNEKKALAYVEKCGDQTTLATIATYAELATVRLAAVGKLKDQSVLSEIVRNERENLQIRRAAMANITDENNFANLAYTLPDEDIQLKAATSTNNHIKLRELAIKAKNPDIQKAAVEQIEDQRSLSDVVMNSRNEMIRKLALSRIKDPGTRFSLIMQKGTLEEKKQALEDLPVNDDRLIDIASGKNIPASGKDVITRTALLRITSREKLLEVATKLQDASQILGRLDELGMLDENTLVMFANRGNPLCVNRLIEMNPEKYIERYESSMTDKMRLKAIDDGLFSEEKLEQLAIQKPLNTEIRDSVAWLAMVKIQSPERLERILLTRKSASNDIMNLWYKRLLDKLEDRENVMTRFLLSNNGPRDLRETVLNNITTPEYLLQIAMENNDSSEDAAKRLPRKGEYRQELRKSKNRKVAAAAMESWIKTKQNDADDEEIADFLVWAMDNYDFDYMEQCQEIVKRIQSQEALLRVFDAYLNHSIRLREKWIAIHKSLLGSITDGAGLAELCLKYPGLVCKDDIDRLKEIIKGTDAEKSFVEESRKQLIAFKYGVSWWWRPTEPMRMYFDLPNNAATAWKVGGQEFIRKVLNLLEKSTEIGDTKMFGQILWNIYKFVPESHEFLSGQKNKKYKKHYDYYDEHCMGNSKSYMTDYILQLEE